MTKKESLIIIEKQKGHCGNMNCNKCAFQACYTKQYGTSVVFSCIVLLQHLELKDEDVDNIRYQYIQTMKQEKMMELAEN